MIDLDNIKNFLIDVLKQSGKIAEKYFKEDFKVSHKADNSIVTEADLKIESFIRNRIKTTYPKFGIIGEEFDDHNTNAEYKFIIDPIDGTNAFAIGTASFGIMICLVKNTIPILSGIYQPISKELWIGDNNRTELNGTTVTTSQLDKNLIVATTGYDLLNKEGVEFFNKLASKFGTKKMGGDCYNYCKLASGNIGVVYEEELKYHDFAPLIPILKGSGAFICDKNGNNISDFSSRTMKEFLVCSNQSILNKIKSFS